MFVKGLIILAIAALIFGSAGYVIYEWFIIPERQLAAERAHFEAHPPTPPPDPSLGDYRKLQEIRKGGDLVAARRAYRDFLAAWPQSTLMDEAKDELGEINTRIFFSKYPAPEKEEYVVRPGDSLARISSRMKTSVELIMVVNQLSGTLINVGDTLMVTHPNFALLINQQKQTVTLFNDGEFFKRYRALEYKMPEKPFQPNSKAKVTSTFALRNGKTLAVGSKGYSDSNRWIMTSAPNLTLYSVDPNAPAPPATPEKKVEEDEDDHAEFSKNDKPAMGIGIDADEMRNLSALVRRGTPITFE